MMIRVVVRLAGAELHVVNVCGDWEVDLRDAQSVRGDRHHYVYEVMVVQSLDRTVYIGSLRKKINKELTLLGLVVRQLGLDRSQSRHCK